MTAKNQNRMLTLARGGDMRDSIGNGTDFDMQRNVPVCLQSGKRPLNLFWLRNTARSIAACACPLQRSSTFSCSTTWTALTEVSNVLAS